MMTRCTSCGLVEHTDTCPDRPLPPSQAISDELVETVAREIERYGEGLVPELRIVCTWLAAHFRSEEDGRAALEASGIERLLGENERMREALTRSLAFITVGETLAPGAMAFRKEVREILGDTA